MKKSSLFSRVFLFGIVWCLGLSVFSENLLKGTESKISVKPTNNNYYLATLTGESESYDPTFYEDYHLCLDEVPILHFTKNGEHIQDLYYYVSDSEDLKSVQTFFKAHKEELNTISDTLYLSFIQYMNNTPDFEVSGAISNVKIPNRLKHQ